MVQEAWIITKGDFCSLIRISCLMLFTSKVNIKIKLQSNQMAN